MKRFISAAGFLLLACNGQGLVEEAAAASAQGLEEDTVKHPGKGPHHRSPEERFAKDDTNGDGSLSADEAGDKWEHLKAADADGSGSVTLAEIKAAMESGVLRPPKRPDFASLDTNGDGSIDATEAGGKWDHLSKADANGDGLVTQAELQAARPKHHHH